MSAPYWSVRAPPVLIARRHPIDAPAGHPFDLTKTRIQTAAPGAYKGALDVVKKTVAQDGITGFVNLAHSHRAEDDGVR